MATLATITVANGAQQSFDGVGFFLDGHSGAVITPTDQATMAGFYIAGVGANTGLVGITPATIAPSKGATVDVSSIVTNVYTGGQYTATTNAGTTTWIMRSDSIPAYDATSSPTFLLNDIPDYARILSQAVDKFRVAGMIITHVDILNEPRSGASIATILPADWPSVINTLRADLDALGYNRDGSGTHQPVFIIGPSCSGTDISGSGNGFFNTIMAAIAASPTAWANFDVVSIHPYGQSMSLTAQGYLTANGTTKKCWATEMDDAAGLIDTVNVVVGDQLGLAMHMARVLNNYNLGVSRACGFNAYASTQRNFTCAFNGYGTSSNPVVNHPLQHYYGWKALNQIMTTGGTLRHATSSIETLYTNGTINQHLYPMAGVNQNGKIFGALQNLTAATWTNDAAAGHAQAWCTFNSISTTNGAAVQTNGGPTGEATYDVTIDMTAEFPTKTATFTYYRTNVPSPFYGGGANVDGTLTPVSTTLQMTNGLMTIPLVGPLDFITFLENTPVIPPVMQATPQRGGNFYTHPRRGVPNHTHSRK